MSCLEYLAWSWFRHVAHFFGCMCVNERARLARNKQTKKTNPKREWTKNDLCHLSECTQKAFGVCVFYMLAVENMAEGNLFVYWVTIGLWLRLCSRMRFFFCRWLSFLLLSVQAYYIHCCREMQSVCIARRSTPSPLHHRSFCSVQRWPAFCYVSFKFATTAKLVLIRRAHSVKGARTHTAIHPEIPPDTASL